MKSLRESCVGNNFNDFYFYGIMLFILDYYLYVILIND